MRNSHAAWALALLFIAGCGGKTTAQRIQAKAAKADEIEEVKLPPVKPEAMRAFEEGMRAIRQAGNNPTSEALDKAKTRLREAVEIDGKIWEAWHNIGVVDYRQGDDDAAVEAFGKALDINPTHTESLLARAEAHRRAGRTKQARTDYENAIARSSDESQVKRNATARLASLLREARQYDDAIGVIRNTLRTAGANAKVYVELGMIYMAKGQDELAELVLAKAASLDAKEPAIYNARALLAQSRGKAQEAFDMFDYATSLDPNYSDARFNKAAVLLDAGDFGRARDELARVLEQDPNDLSVLVAYGVALRGLGEHKKAKETWERVVSKAARRTQERGDALFNLAMLQMNFLEDEKAARETLDRYLQEAPRNHPKRKQAEEKQKELGP